MTVDIRCSPNVGVRVSRVRPARCRLRDFVLGLLSADRLFGRWQASSQRGVLAAALLLTAVYQALHGHASADRSTHSRRPACAWTRTLLAPAQPLLRGRQEVSRISSKSG